MNKKEQRKFISALIKTVKKEIMTNSKKFPANWDGIELRRYIAYKFNECIMHTSNWTKKRKNNYFDDLLEKYL